MEVTSKQVREAAQVLVVRPGFRVVERACYTCGWDKDIVLLIVPPSLA